ncbi:alpha/beta fold hydrolase [Xanthomonas floridensis]|uniref:Alpha/beta fold hydrolase n=1 Tax=Xanthomonas floridensis TaxID=1843580 RepID=A0ABU5Q2X5_9XANT|nr:alpha/beta fold hydrolase [Xanthomonas floridensis]MEA5126236.1 alpha/beta fold hydrolase [Xanthomonas floridensis]MEA5134188.1 alpha/beta fold hydrolase [Xanthomonas floridensis]
MPVRFFPVAGMLPMRCALACLLLLSSTLAAAVTPASRTYTVTAPDGVTLAVQEHGAGDAPAIVFVHGLLGSRINWDAQLADPLLQRYRLITYDLRGHGLSGKPTAASAYQDGARWADDLAAVLKAANAHDAVLVGWSLGGAVISNYLSRYGDDGLGGAVYVDGVIELRAQQLGAHPAIYRDLVSDDLRTHLQAVYDFLRLCFATQPPVPVFDTLLANGPGLVGHATRSARHVDRYCRPAAHSAAGAAGVWRARCAGAERADAGACTSAAAARADSPVSAGRPCSVPGRKRTLQSGSCAVHGAGWRWAVSAMGSGGIAW